MTETSTIEYDHDHPHEMKMVFVEWCKTYPLLNSEAIMIVYDEWIAGRVKLMIDQKVWNRIVVTYL